MNETPAIETAPHYTWFQVWTAVLLRPGVATFEKILRDPTAKKERAYRWAFWAGTIGFALLAVVTQIRVLSQPGSASVPGNDAGSVVFVLGCTTLFGGIFSFIGFIFNSLVFQASARMVGGRANFGTFHYAYGAFYAPLMLINILVSTVAFGGTGVTSFVLVNLALMIYQLVLTVIAIKAVNQFTTGRTLLAMVGPTIIVVLSLIGLVIAWYPVLRWMYLFQF